MKRLHCVGWNSVAVITSVNSSIFTGLISTISDYECHNFICNQIGHSGTGYATLTKTLVASIEVPEVNAQIVRRNVRFLVRVDRDGMDVVGVGVGINFPGYSGYDIVLLGHARQPQVACT